LRDRVVKNRKPLPEAILGANHRLDAKGLGAFDPKNESDRTKAIARTIGVSLDLLDQSERARFSELGIFPEDANIPIGIVARLWAETGGLDEFETEDLLSTLHDLSLLLNLDLNQRILRLHDTVRHFLQDQAGNDGLLALHKRLLPVLDNVGTSTSRRAHPALFLPLSSLPSVHDAGPRKARCTLARSGLAQSEARSDWYVFCARCRL
jgi:hypothetical protein